MIGGMGAGQALGARLGPQGARGARRRALRWALACGTGKGAAGGPMSGARGERGGGGGGGGGAERVAGAAGDMQARAAIAAIRPCWPTTQPGGLATTGPDRPRHGHPRGAWARPVRAGWASWGLVQPAWFLTWFFDSLVFLSHRLDPVHEHCSSQNF